MMDAEHFFSAAEKERIAATIKVVEGETAGEIAVMVVDASDTYPEGIVLGGVILGGLAALAVTDYFLNASLWLYVPCAVTGALLTALALKFLPAVHRLFVPVRQLEHRVRVRAEQAFFAKGLHHTRDHSGVLFFLSLFERRVWVLADQGIYQKISQDELQTYATQVTTGLKSGRKSEALCAEITRFGKLLAQHFPIRTDDSNELANEVIAQGRRKP